MEQEGLEVGLLTGTALPNILIPLRPFAVPERGVLSSQALVCAVGRGLWSCLWEKWEVSNHLAFGTDPVLLSL